MRNPLLTFALLAGSLLIPLKGQAAATLLGPSPYLCFDRTGTSPLAPGFTGSCGTTDSPFATTAASGGFSYFYLDTFEDHVLGTPGVTASAGGVTSVVFGPSAHDSVDADDGVIDGSGLDGDSFFSSSGAAGITFSFSAGILGMLPTHVGIVWTDGAGTTSFSAYGSAGQLLGTIGPVSIADGSVFGTTGEDRFFGVIDPAGISAIHISNEIGGIEVDHLQYGHAAASTVPEPDSLTLMGLGLTVLAAGGLQRKKR